MKEQKKRLFRLQSVALCKLSRRLFALLLAILLSVQLVPSAAAGDLTASETTSTETESSEQPAYNPPPPVNFKASDEKPASGGSSMTNTYMMEVGTGTVRNGGNASNVKYFVIYYTDVQNKVRSEVIFPGKDVMRKSLDAASSVANRDGRRGRVESIFGYTTAALRDRKGLGSDHTDQYLFTTPTAVKTIDRIQIFGKMDTELQPDGSVKEVLSTWACQSLHIARVDQLYGLEMYGWYSDDGYIDYKGEIIADVVMPDGGGIFRWQTSGGVHNIVGPGVSGGFGVTLLNTSTVANYHKPNFVGTQHDSQVSNRVVFRMDMADMGGAGFESLAGSYQAGYESKIKDLKFCETAAMKIRYEDIYGAIRIVYVPVIVNSLGWTMEKVGEDLAIAGFAQQGDSIPISLMLPDFKRLVAVDTNDRDHQSVEFVVGESKAREYAHLQTSSGADQSIRPGRVKLADTETCSYLCLAAYRDVIVGIQHDSATLRYTYTPGAKEPFSSITAGSVEGVPLDGGTSSVLPMDAYRENMKILPYDNRDIYLFTFCTDNVENAGMTQDIFIQLRYTNMRDKEVLTSELNLKEYAQQFYGEWAGNHSNFGYLYGLRPGGTLQVMIPFTGVKQFKSISIKVSGQDEWQFKGIRIQKIRSYSPRISRWHEINESVTSRLVLQSHLMVSREIHADPKVFEIGTIYDKTHPVLPPSNPDWTPGTLIQDDGEYHEFNGYSEEIAAREPINWEDYRYYMTYEDTQQELGFDKIRCNYRVTVKVFGSKSNANDDDCGSANLFYFQLLFEDGNSPCVLANQQLSGDAFRTGEEAEFYISTTQDYGELESIRVIPDDQDSNSDIYDKLQIEYIKVKKESTGKINPTWTAGSDSKDGLGWVGIDYRDPGAASSNRGATGRSISEISHTFEITSTSYSTKLLISISTGEYNPEPVTNAQGETTIVTPEIMEGGMSAILHYYDHEGRPQSKKGLDVIHLMNQYAGLEDQYSRTIKGVTEPTDYCVSNPDYQFRGGRMDKFYVDVDNIQKIVKMELMIKANNTTKWTIDNVAVYLVQGEGHRYINGNGEYDYRYDEGQDLSLRCCWDRPQSLTKEILAYRTADSSDYAHQVEGSSIMTININFGDNDFPIGEDESWTSTLSREPDSKDDTLNLFVYPSTESSATSPSEYGLTGEVLFTDTLHQSAMRIDTKSMSFGEDSTGQPVFYKVGLTANYFESLTGVIVHTDTVRPVHVPINHAILQRVRDGVLIDTYYLMGAGNADNTGGVSLYTVPHPGGENYQHLLLQVNEDAEYQRLVKEERDLAVALHFTTDDPYGNELRTKYIYLTDQGYTEINGGQVLDLKFSIPNLKEITGLTLVNMGRLNLAFTDGEVIQQSLSGSVQQKWSFRGNMTPTKNPARFSLNGTVSLLDLDLKTAASDGSVNSGTDGPIRMTVGYLDMSGNEMTRVYDDVRKFSYDERRFESGHLDHIRLLIEDMSELRWVEFEPLSKAKDGAVEGSEQIAAAWKLESVAAAVDLGFQMTKITDKLILEKEPLRVSFAEILLAGIVSTIQNENDSGTASGDYTIPTGGALDLALNIGEGVRIVPVIQGSRDGVYVTLNRFDPSTGALGRAELIDSRGYTQEILDGYAQAARQDGKLEEAAVWSSVEPDDGYWEVKDTYDAVANRTYTDAIVFIPPHNYTGASVSYRITLTSRENSESTAYVTVTIPSETNPVDALLAEAREKDSAAAAGHVHSIVLTPAEAPTCTDTGHKSYYSCSGCGQYFSDALGNTVISLASVQTPALGHSYGGWRSNGNTHSRVCGRCGETETEDCTFSAWTSNGNGKHTGKCSVCGGTLQDDCSYEWVDKGDGEHHRVVCSVCGYVENENEDHDYAAPTVTEDGHATMTCRKCGYVKHLEIPDETQPGSTEPETGSTEP